MVGAIDNNIERMIPSEYELSNAYPNPFNPTTTINYQIPKEGHVILRVYAVLGREVATLVNELKASGRNSVNFYASTLASGVYYYSIGSGDFHSMKKMMLLK